MSALSKPGQAAWAKPPSILPQDQFCPAGHWQIQGQHEQATLDTPASAPQTSQGTLWVSVRVRYFLCCHQHPQLPSGKLFMPLYLFSKYLLKTTKSPQALRQMPGEHR